MADVQTAHLRLSPLNLSGLLATLRALPDDAEAAADDRVEEVRMWRCLECREVHDEEEDARDCCRKAVGEPGQSPHCPVCNSNNPNHRDAADCCLWKDLEAPTRWRTADAVEAGSTWAEQLGAAKHHALLPPTTTPAESPTHV